MIDLRERMRGALRDAMKARDKAAVSALRSALAAIDDAEAVDNADAPVPVTTGVEPTSTDIAGTVAGLGAGDVARHHLSSAQANAVVRTAITERETVAAQYDDVGRTDAADVIRYEIRVLSAFVDGEPTG